MKLKIYNLKTFLELKLQSEEILLLQQMFATTMQELLLFSPLLVKHSTLDAFTLMKPNSTLDMFHLHPLIWKLNNVKLNRYKIETYNKNILKIYIVKQN